MNHYDDDYDDEDTEGDFDFVGDPIYKLEQHIKLLQEDIVDHELRFKLMQKEINNLKDHLIEVNFEDINWATL